jgi:hypothetical protein
MTSEIEQNANERIQSIRNLKKVMVGGLVAGLTGLVAGNVLDSETIKGLSYGVLASDAFIYVVYTTAK